MTSFVDGSAQQFAFRYGFWRLLLSMLGCGPASSRIEVDDATMRVAMGWAFRATIDLASVRSVRRTGNRWAGIGVHGAAGRWLVNGTVAGIVRVDIDPPGQARVLGFRVRLRTLELSAEDPDGLIAAVQQVAR